MWVFKDIILMVGCVIMTAIAIIGIIGLGFDIREIHNNIGSWNLTWFEFGFIVLAISFWVIVIKLILRLNRFEIAKPSLIESGISFPFSGYRIVRKTDKFPFEPQVGYAKVGIRNTGGLLEDCIGTVKGIANVTVSKGQLRIMPLLFTESSLFWENGKIHETIPNDGLHRYLHLAFLDQNKPDSWQLAIEQPKRVDYFKGWHKIDIVISSSKTQMKPLKVELALGYGVREYPPPALNLWPWELWQYSVNKQIQQATDKEGFQLE